MVRKTEDGTSVRPTSTSTGALEHRFIPESKEDALTFVRRGLLRLALDGSGDIVVQATDLISSTLGYQCVFVCGDQIPDASVGYTPLAVRVDNEVIGMLFIGSAGESITALDEATLQEIADLVGMCQVQMDQVQMIVDLQEESADMLFHAPDAIFVLNLDGKIGMANRKALDLIGMEVGQAEGRLLGDVLHTTIPASEKLVDMAQERESMEVEIGATGEGVEKKLALLTLSEVGEEDQLLCVARDITQERQAQLALRRSQRSSLMGQTVEYLLHEVNNPLAALLAMTRQAQKHGYQIWKNAALSQDDKVSNRAEKMNVFLENSRVAGERIRSTMDTLRSVHGKQETSDSEVIDVGYELGVAINAVEFEHEGGSPIYRELGPLPQIQAPSLCLAEVFGAIIRNAVDAVGNDPRARVTIRAEATEAQLRVLIEDNGPGVPANMRQQIFMPFFTTKSPDNALGLGLTMADDAIRRLGGTVTYEQPHGGGARFVVLLPLNG